MASFQISFLRTVGIPGRWELRAISNLTSKEGAAQSTNFMIAIQKRRHKRESRQRFIIRDENT